MAAATEPSPPTNGSADPKPADKPSQTEDTVTNGTDDSKPDEDKKDDADDKTTTPPKPRGSVCEIKSLVQKGDAEVIEKDAYQLSLDKAPHASYAIVTKQHFNEHGKLVKTTVEINSPYLLAGLKEVVEYYPAEPLDFQTSVSYDDPFKLLNQHRVELAGYAEKQSEEDAKAHFKLLFDFLDNELGDKKLQSDKLIEAGLVTFEHLWMIYKPGDLLYFQEYDHERLFRLQKTGYQDSDCPKGKFFELNCEYTNCDGDNAGYSNVNLQIWEKREFVGKTGSRITTLSVIPLKFWPGDADELKARLATRGERYLEIRGVQTLNYEGLFMYLKTPPHDYYNEEANFDGVWLPRSGAGRVVVDCKTFVEEMRSQKEEISRWRSQFFGAKTDGTTSSSGPRTADSVEAMLCPPYVYGFSLDMKEWCKFFVESLHPFDWTPNAMDQLILPSSQRTLISALVTSHTFPDQARDESLLKGKGLIILLHGSPGTGKTLTAELVAEHTRRPLLKISTGELGSWGERIAEELKRHLEYAAIWKAVVLIDEADVFLEERKSGPEGGSIDHNHMVALFLKQLEYYQGILFLTSNRVEVFDRAIRSRIHLALQYESPGPETRRKMWEQQLQREGVQCTLSGDALSKTLEDLSKAEMNGREIANAVNTAQTLALSEGKDEASGISGDHLKMVVDIWEGFNVSLKKIEETSRKERAEKEA